MADKSKSTFARRIRAAKPRATKYEIRDDGIAGLGLSIQPSGVRSFFLAHGARAQTLCLDRQRRHHDRPRGAPRGPQADRQLHRAGEDRQWPQDAGAPDERIRRRVPRTLRPALETPHPGQQRLYRAQAHPARLRPPCGGRDRRRTRQGLVRLHGRDARQRQPLHADPLRDDEDGRALGIPPPQLQSLQEDEALPGAGKGAVPDGGGNGPVQRRAHPRRVLVPPYRRHPPFADADRMPLRRDRLARMGQPQGQTDHASRLEVRAAHGLAFERRPCGHRHHPALQCQWRSKKGPPWRCKKGPLGGCGLVP